MPLNVIVVGGGASGLTAAVFAARNKNKVTIIEHKDRVGKKILMTGNGKCNLTNISGMHGKYYSSGRESPDKIYDTFVRFGADDTRKFFESMGLFTKEKCGGGVYPVSEQASAVLDALRYECEHLKVNIMTDCEVKKIIPDSSGGKVKVVKYIKEERLTLNYDKIIIAAGGKAASFSGSDGTGYSLVKMLGHTVIEPLPALVQLRCEGSFFKSLSGVRAQADLTLYIDGKKEAFEEGELQLTDYGISGIPVFQFSRIASRALYENKRCEVSINFLPYVNDWEGFCKNLSLEKYGHKTVEMLLSGMVHKKIASMICRKRKLNPGMRFAVSEKEAMECVYELFDFRVKVTDTNGFENAQVCCGGVPLCEVTDGFESKKCKNVYIIGELLDCDGICGGYNLQWAWSTGAIAGRLQ